MSITPGSSPGQALAPVSGYGAGSLPSRAAGVSCPVDEPVSQIIERPWRPHNGSSASSGQACSETGYPFSLFCLLYLHYLPPSKLEGERSSFGNSPSASALKLLYACSICPRFCSNCPVLGRFTEKPDARVLSDAWSKRSSALGIVRDRIGLRLLAREVMSIMVSGHSCSCQGLGERMPGPFDCPLLSP